MAQSLCVVVEYVYKRKLLPGSKIWHMQSSRDDEPPSELEVGDSKIRGNGDTVSILIAVPCDQYGTISPETKNKYEDLADEKFLQVRPDADFA